LTSAKAVEMAGRRKRMKGDEMFSFMMKGGNDREMSD
jgi:hypothetical protein